MLRLDHWLSLWILLIVCLSYISPFNIHRQSCTSIHLKEAFHRHHSSSTCGSFHPLTDLIDNSSSSKFCYSQISSDVNIFWTEKLISDKGFSKITWSKISRWLTNIYSAIKPSCPLPSVVPSGTRYANNLKLLKLEEKQEKDSFRLLYAGIFVLNNSNTPQYLALMMNI